LLKVGAQTVWILNPDVTLLEWDHGLVQEQLTGNDEKIWATPTQENGQTTPGLRSLNTWTGRSHRLSHATAGARGRGVVYPSGHSIIMSARAWNRLGGFDDAYFLFFEESDLAIRAAEHRVAIGTLRGVKVHHDQGLSTGASPVARRKSQLAFEFATASGAIFFRKHFPRRLAAFVIVRVIFALYVGLRVNRGAMTAVLIGLRRGLAHCPGSGGAA
jgi:GT2 family glycosyltransferase